MSTHQPLTLSEVIDQLVQMRAQHPERGWWPVHVIDMDDSPDEHPWDGLVTHVEHDCYTDEQGWVVDLAAWQDKP